MLKRKGLSMPFAKTAGLILGVLGLLVGVQVITNVHNNSLDPNANKINNALDSLGATTVTIGSQEVEGENIVSDPSDLDPESQFRGVMAFNMMSAVNCDMVMYVDHYLYGGNEQQSHPYIPEYNPPEGAEGRVQYFEGWKRVINETEFQGNCFGAKAIDLNPVDDVVQNLNPLSVDESETANDMEGRYGRINFNVETNFTIGDGKLCDPDYSVGTHSQNLDVSEEYLHNNCSEILMGIVMNKSHIVDSGHPGFWTGARNAVFIPAGLEWDDNDGKMGGSQEPWSYELYADEYNDKYNENADNKVKHDHGIVGDYPSEEQLLSMATAESGGYTGKLGWSKWISDSDDPEAKLYKSRIRMANVPIVQPAIPAYRTKDFELNNNGDDSNDQIGADCNSCGSGENPLELFIEQAQYRFCEGVSGFMQTNAKSMSNGGEATGDKAFKENAVYPKAEITGGNPTSCIPLGSEREKSNFYGYEVNGEETCSVGEAIEGENRTFSISGGEVELQCSFRENSVSFHNWDGEPDVYRPGWFCEGECQKTTYLLDEAEYSNTYDYVDDQEYWEPGEGSNPEYAYLYVSEEDSYPSLTWDLPSRSGSFKLKLSPDTDPSYDGDGHLYIDVNGNDNSEAFVTWHSYDDISYFFPGTEEGDPPIEKREFTKEASKTNWTITVNTASNELMVNPDSKEAIRRELDEEGIERIDKVQIQLAVNNAQVVLKNALYK